MAKVIKLNSELYIKCPGCGNRHTIGSGWDWNGDYERPTIMPSILVRTGHYMPKHQGSCWCTYNAEHPDDPYPYECFLCHSFITDGRIQFLGDCTHALVGQTVELPDID